MLPFLMRRLVSESQDGATGEDNLVKIMVISQELDSDVGNYQNPSGFFGPFSVQ